MAAQTMSVRFAPEEREWIQAYATFTGESVSDVIRNAVLEKLEDVADVLAYNEAQEEDDDVRYSMEEIAKEIGLDR